MTRIENAKLKIEKPRESAAATLSIFNFQFSISASGSER
jgi:hypothetical protein